MATFIMEVCMAIYNAMTIVVDAGLYVIDAHPMAALMTVIVVALVMGVRFTKEWRVIID